MAEATPRQKIVIIGLGLIGGSIGLALKSAGLSNIRIIGHDVDGRAMSRARKRGAIDDSDGNIITAVRGSSCIIIAAPVMAIRRIFQEIAPHLEENAIVTDTGSSKLEVLKWAADELPQTVNFIGGHPMAGKEQGGIDAAEPGLFKDATYCVVPLPNASDGAVQAVLSLIAALGAKPWFVDPEEHDRYAAAISHMPMILSNALFTMARGSKAWLELSRMAGPGFKDMTRLASQDPEMELDVITTNKDGIVHWLDRMQEEIDHWKELVQSDEETLFQALHRASLDREEYIQHGPREPAFQSRSEMPENAELAEALFMGRWGRRLREMTKFYEDKAKAAEQVRKR
ncbi:MAG TPA: prephenate dehydrogenase/arogenate dehydrogenase family protein [Dehalococcoidia bacterium]|nr:prephenate dehydrogenase/arogenate dehydrogenase family protein [Dehalococcoidia bacterium]